MKFQKLLRLLTMGLAVPAVLLAAGCAPQPAQDFAPQYYAPLQDSNYVSTGATIVVRYGPLLNTQALTGLNFNVQGSQSGNHNGQAILADDRKTVIFKPAQPFAPGEQVKVQVNGLNVDPENRYRPLAYSFTVAKDQKPGTVGTASEPASANSVHSAFPNFLTVPQDIPHFNVTKTTPDNGEGDILVAPFYWTKSTAGSYLLILNSQGQLVYHQSMADQLAAFDFKVQPNGLLSYFDQKDSTYYLMNSHYQVVDHYTAGNGYVADLHDFQLLPNGNALLMAYDQQTVNMGLIVPGGKPDAAVTGLIIQELDPSKNVIFEWRSWDHFSYFDTTVDLTAQQIDLIHGNALALANDGNLLLSSRNLSEITKINLQTGDIIWRLGGKGNTLKLVGGQPFAFQHDVRELPNGDITVFDNQGSIQAPAASMSLEYQIDETKKTATQVWNFTHNPPVFATFMGDTQRFADGNTFLDWGAPSQVKGYAFVSASEVDPNGNLLFEMVFDPPYVSYRAFRFPWHASPLTVPDLAAKQDGSNALTLGYSWNGATEVASYQVYGGNSPQSLGPIEQRAKTDFETQSHLTGLAQGECYFQVAALDQSGREMARSKVISTDPSCPAVK